MKAFIYNWETRSTGIVAHALDKDGKYTHITVDRFKPFCFVETEDEGELMASSEDILEKKHYKKVEFDTCKEMETFASGRKGVFMNDIPLISLFLGAEDYPPTGWYDVNKGRLNPLREDVTPTYPKVACFDIECKSSTGQGMPKPYRRKDVITMISIVFHRYLENIEESVVYLLYLGERKMGEIEGCTISSFKGEEEMIEGFAKIIIEEDPDVITGYNIFGFDFDYILSRLKLNLRPLPDFSRNGTTQTYRVDWASNAYGENFYNRIECSGRVFIDMMLYFRRQKLDSYSLDFVSKKYLGRGKLDVQHRSDFDLTEYGRYCINDSVLTLRLFDKFYMWTDVCEMSRAMRCSIEDIYTRGEQMKVVNQAVWSCLKRGIVLKRRRAQEPREYQGAYVLEPEKGIYENCSVVDFQSMYPSILIAYNICPSTYVTRGMNVHRIAGTRHAFRKSPPGILPHMVQSLLSERKMVKGMLKSRDIDPMTRVILDARQLALKVCANSIYGITGSRNSKYFSSVECAESTTGMGRTVLKRVIDFIGEAYSEKVRVIYGDTDSCMMTHKTEENHIELARKICADVTSKLPDPMVLDFEEYYDKMLFMSKKRYIMYRKGGEIRYKGVANARRNYCMFARRLFSEVIERVLDPEKGNAEKHLLKSLIRLATNEIPLNDLVMSKSIKTLETYKSESLPQVIMMKRLLKEGTVLESGSRMEYIFTKNDQKLQGHKMYTPEEVSKESMKIDYSYYIQKQIVPIMEDVFGKDNYAKQFSKLEF